MMATIETPPAFAPLALAEVKDYLRIMQDEDDALLAGLIRSAAMTCERFVGMALLQRETRETIPASAEWRRLTQTPVAAITGVETRPESGDPAAPATADYEIDIDGNGDGWMRVTNSGGARRVTVTYSAGMGADWNAVPEPLRQGIARLVAHLFTHRDDRDDPGPPAAVAALWRPWRRMRLS